MNSNDSIVKMAVTIDDLPFHGSPEPGTSHLELHLRLISAFSAGGITDVCGFVNGHHLEKHSEGAQILSAWVNAGHQLGNHTYSHLDFRNVEPNEFINDIKRNEDCLSRHSKGRDFRLFRYPYLLEGETLKKRHEVRDFLFSSGYQIAHVTIDFRDFAWNEPYLRCLARKDIAGIRRLRELYIEAATDRLDLATKLSLRIFGRDINHILLLHSGIATSAFLTDLMCVYKKLGCVFIPLREALLDEAYQIDPNVLSDRGPNFLGQLVQSRSIPKVHSRALPFDELNRIGGARE